MYKRQLQRWLDRYRPVPVLCRSGAGDVARGRRIEWNSWTSPDVYKRQSICNLSKSFGEQKIIKNLNLSVPEGSVFGFIGQNGAGKTTTMKMVLGLLQPDEGEIRVCNEPVRFGQTKTNQYIGYLPDVPEFYNYMTAIQYLTPVSYTHLKAILLLEFLFPEW